MLIEFAITAFLLYLLIAGGVELGRAIFVAQTLQDAARVAARELALAELPAQICFEDPPPGPMQMQQQQMCNPGGPPYGALTYVSADESVKVPCQIWDPNQLVLDLDIIQKSVSPFCDSDCALHQAVAAMPVVNRALFPLFISEAPTVAGTTRHLLRYPGALLSVDPTVASMDMCPGFPNSGNLTVGVPSVTRDAGTGQETAVTWLPIVQEVRSTLDDPTTGPFSFGSSIMPKGIVALEINYPFQSAALSAYLGSRDTNDLRVIQANDGAIPPSNPLNGASFANPLYPELDCSGNPLDPRCDSANPYAGSYGLGRQYAFTGQVTGQPVRPYRKLLTGQAIFRREVVSQ